jgi:hypothetical protein
MTSGNDWPHSPPARLRRNTQTPIETGHQLNAPNGGRPTPAGRPTSHHRPSDAKSESPECGVTAGGGDERVWPQPRYSGASGDGSDRLRLDNDADRDRKLPVRSLGRCEQLGRRVRGRLAGITLGGVPDRLAAVLDCHNEHAQTSSFVSAPEPGAFHCPHPHMTGRRTLSSLHDATLWITQTASGSSGPRSGSSTSRPRSSGRSSSSSRSAATAVTRSPVAAATTASPTSTAGLPA